MRNRHVSLCVEWAGEKNIPEVSALLAAGGALDLYVDEEMDEQYIPGQSFTHTHTVFRFRAGRAAPVHELLSALAMRPDVHSAGEIP